MFIFLGTLCNTSQQSKRNTPKKTWGQSALSLELENNIVKSLDCLTNWKIPFDGFGVRCLVKAYLDQEKLQIKYFKNNFPGPDWLQGFMKRHRLTKRITDNVKPLRAEVNEDVINSYFQHLKESLKDVPSSNLFNYDETNVTDDPGSKQVITHHGRNSRKKSSPLKIIYKRDVCRYGTYLPPSVGYKSENIYCEYVSGGPYNTVYSCTKSGWFDSATFETWFFKQFLPSTQGLEGPIALIGDNLG